MREIKFRQLTLRGWHYWGVIDGAYIGPADPRSANPIAESQQFTGLLDCNGKEIYEGDIVRHICDADEEPMVAPVAWYEPTKQLALVYGERSHNPLYMMLWCEVIGNIHENPELLEGATL